MNNINMIKVVDAYKVLHILNVNSIIDIYRSEVGSSTRFYIEMSNGKDIEITPTDFAKILEWASWIK